MTMPFSAAAAAVLDATAAPDHGVYSYSTEVEFLMKTTASHAPTILSLILAKLVLDEPTIIFKDTNNKGINQSELPTEKSSFDAIFSTTSSAGRLTCRFAIKSDRRSFHPIKMGVWDILQQHGVYFKKSAAPVKKISLSTLGFWVNVHPSFASPHVFHAEICESIQLPYSSDPALLKQLNLAPEYTDPDIYLKRRKLSAPFYAPDGTTSPIDTEVFVTYANSDDSARSLVLLTRISTFTAPLTSSAPLFIPMELKYKNPKQFGAYIAKQNEFLNNHRNIAIVGVVPAAMDYKDTGELDLYSCIKNLPGVYRCDPTRRTPDLGKWNISCHSEHHQAICHWVDEHLVAVWQTIPLDLPEIDSFPTTERLSKGRRALRSSLSVASGLTNASPVADYMKTLESRFVGETAVPQTTRNPWTTSVPLKDVTYSFDAATFPPFPTNKTSTTRTTATETAPGATAEGATAISAITEGLLLSAISGVEQKCAAASADFDNHLKTLELHIADINDTVINMSTKTTNEVMRRLSALDGPLAKQNSVLLEHTNKMERMYTMLLTLTGNLYSVTSSVAPDTTMTDPSPSPARSPRDRDTTDDGSNRADTCHSPDRKRLNQGLVAPDANDIQIE
jgi:hypothetical protein